MMSKSAAYTHLLNTLKFSWAKIHKALLLISAYSYLMNLAASYVSLIQMCICIGPTTYPEGIYKLFVNNLWSFLYFSPSLFSSSLDNFYHIKILGW